MRNLKKKNKVKALTKQVRKLALAKTPQEAQQLLPQAYKAIDKAAKTGVLKKAAADRKKSRLAKLTGKQATNQPKT